MVIGAPAFHGACAAQSASVVVPRIDGGESAARRRGPTVAIGAPAFRGARVTQSTGVIVPGTDREAKAPAGGMTWPCSLLPQHSTAPVSRSPQV